LAGYSQSDESTGQTVDSYTSRAGAFMARENSTGSMAAGQLLPKDALNACDLVKVQIAANDLQAVLTRQRGNPQIIFRDWPFCLSSLRTLA
jgi:hypothetical protein